MSVPVEGALIADRYRVERAIGAGAMGAVFAVRDERSHRRYALKWITTEGQNLEQVNAWVQREIKALQVLQHPAILQLFDHGTDADAHWVVTELLEGADLLQRVDRAGALDGPTCAAVAAVLCSALAAAHKEGIVHRDVKPGNIFLCDDGRFILLDFGIAKAAEGARQDTMAKSANTVVAGTVSFLSPELLAGGRGSPQSDMFAVGGTLQWLVTCALPFAGTTMLDVMRSIAANRRQPIARTDLPKELVQTLDRLLDPDPSVRPSADACAAAFTKMAGGDEAVRQTLRRLAQRRDEAQDTEPNASQTQIVTAKSNGQTRIVTNVQTAPTAKPPRRTQPLLIALPVIALVAAVATVVIVKKKPKPVAAAPVPPPRPSEPPLPPTDTLPPPTAPEAVEKPPPVEAPQDDRPGVLALSFEHWVELNVDGKALGRKEFATKISLSPGKHTVVAQHPKFGARRFAVDAKAGRTSTLHIDLSSP